METCLNNTLYLNRYLSSTNPFLRTFPNPHMFKTRKGSLTDRQTLSILYIFDGSVLYYILGIVGLGKYRNSWTLNK